MFDFRRRWNDGATLVVRLWRALGAWLAATGASAADLNKRLVTSFAERRFPTWKQFKYIGTVLTASERRALRAAGALLLLALLALGGRLWAKHVVAVPAIGGEYVEAVVGAPSLPNPLYAAGNDVDADLVRLLYAGLVTTTADGRILPDLAESYEISENGKEYLFRLKDRLIWHDGERLSAADVLFTVKLIQNEAYRSPLLPAFRAVRAEQVDERTVRFVLDKPSASFLSTLTVGILPQHIWQDVPPAGVTLAEYNMKPVGAGPYRFKSFTRDKLGAVRSYTVERFARAATPALLERLIFRFYPDAESAVAAAAAKQADGIGFVPLELRGRVEARPDLARFLLWLPQYTAVFFNPKAQPIFADDAVRAALLSATPREKILREVLRGEGELVDSPLVKGMPGYDAALTQASYDAAAARVLFDQAGYRLSSATATVREKIKTKKITIGKGKKATTNVVSDGKPIPLAVTLTTVDRPENIAVAEIIIAAWREVGVGVELVTVSAQKRQPEELRNHSYQALLFGEVLGADLDPYPFWHSSQGGAGGFNFSLYTNRSVDDSLVAGRTSNSSDARAAAYATLAKKIVADTPAIFLYRPSYPYYLPQSVKGVRASLLATPSDRLVGVRDWYLKTQRAWR